MDAAAYRRLLLRLIAVPIVAVCVLAFSIVYGFQQVQRTARRVEHTDQVIAHANYLVKLLVDQETGLRGFLLTRDPLFLQPYNEANQRLDTEFATLLGMVRRHPDQTARLERLQAGSAAWREMARQATALPAPLTNAVPQMLQRKVQMDACAQTRMSSLPSRPRTV